MTVGSVETEIRSRTHEDKLVILQSSVCLKLCLGPTVNFVSLFYCDMTQVYLENSDAVVRLCCSNILPVVKSLKRVIFLITTGFFSVSTLKSKTFELKLDWEEPTTGLLSIYALFFLSSHFNSFFFFGPWLQTALWVGKRDMWVSSWETHWCFVYT